MTTCRNLQESDYPLIQAWIASDPEHATQNMRPEFFGASSTLSLVFENDGHPSLFVRLDPYPDHTVRLHIQFGPSQVTSAKAMILGWPDFMQRVWTSGVQRMIFETHNPRLAAFCSRVFGFRRVAGTDDYELFKDI